MKIPEIKKGHWGFSEASVTAILALLVPVAALTLTACGRTSTAATTSTSSPAVLGTGASEGATAQHGLVWKFKTGAAGRSSPAVVGGVVFFGSDDGYLYAVK